MKVIRATILALLFAAALGVPGVSAQPAQPAHPTRAQSSCYTTTWHTYWGNVHEASIQGILFQESTANIKAGLNVLVDGTTGAYCGEVQAIASDQLTDTGAGCVNFQGDAYLNAHQAVGSSWGPIYHCTLTTYIFSGPVWNETCGSGSHLYAENVATLANGAQLIPEVYFGPFNC